MKPKRRLLIDPRRTPQFLAELRERARAWVQGWDLGDGSGDFGAALLEIAARLNSEVAQRLDRLEEKNARGLLDWLGVRGDGARPARLPVVFRMTENAPASVLAAPPVRLQADAGGPEPAIFETDDAVRVVPARLETVVGVDVQKDAFYLQSGDLTRFGPPEALPTEWTVQSFASNAATRLQLNPELGLVPDMLFEIDGKQHRIAAVEGSIITFAPPIDAAEGIEAGSIVRKVVEFAPYDDGAIDSQDHAVYIGDENALNIEAAASIRVVVTGDVLPADAQWHYWGKRDKEGDQEPDWRELTVQSQSATSITLVKPKGTVDTCEIIADKPSRWIRMRGRAGSKQLAYDSLALLINPRPDAGEAPKCPFAASDEDRAPALEGFANTTPLVLNDAFYPLGREPRQFDAFYLGSAEAFSKKGATVQMCVEMATPTLATVSGAPIGNTRDVMLFGVGSDGYLHVFRMNQDTRAFAAVRDPVQPSKPMFSGSPPPGVPSRAALPRPVHRLPVWGASGQLHVAVAAGKQIWKWTENSVDPGKNSGWTFLGSIDSNETEDTPSSGFLYLAGVGPNATRLVMARGGELFSAPDSGGVWTKESLPPGIPFTPSRVVSLAAILLSSDLSAGGQVDRGLIATFEDGRLFRWRPYGPDNWKQIGGIGAYNLAHDVTPMAVAVGTSILIVTASSRTSVLVVDADTSTETPTTVPGVPQPIGLDAELVGHLIEAAPTSGTDPPIAQLCIKKGDANAQFASILPLRPVANAMLVPEPVPVGIGRLNGPPTRVGDLVLVPGANSDLLAAKFVAGTRVAATVDKAKVKEGLVIESPLPMFSPGDRVFGSVNTQHEERKITGRAPLGGRTLYLLDDAFSGAVDATALRLFRTSAPAPFSGKKTAPTEMELDDDDHDTEEHDLVVLDRAGGLKLAEVLSIKPGTGGKRVATLDTGVTLDPMGYWPQVQVGTRIVPTVELDPATNGNWLAEVLSQAQVSFQGAVPGAQRAEAFAVSGGKPVLLALESQWRTPPAASMNLFSFAVSPPLQDWTRLLGDVSTNPELSWEYWNGSGWWKLEKIEVEATDHLKRSGLIQFEVPDDLRETDWSGRKNHWIRARLVGGDYGRERVVVTTTVKDTKVSEQTVDRSTDEIHAPVILRLQVRYSIDQNLEPAWVVTTDSGATRDQSDANRTAGAIVEAFVPLSVSLGRLEYDATRETPPRALYLGFSGKLELSGINLLMLIGDERNHDAFAPAGVDALRNNRFEPVATQDETRALGESGLIRLSVPKTTTAASLFGKSLHWLRIRPRGANPDEWKPRLRGAFINAAWAHAAETLQFEMLGASEGAPNHRVALARPPVLRGSLELRVREPLNDEERLDLLRADGQNIRSDVPDQPGDWVLWRQVDDTDDREAGERVYSLDEDLGVIRFGDGLHGAIPPIGNDAIMAFRYQRSGSASSNNVAAWSNLSLVTPVESVEVASNPERPAGGTDPGSVQRTLRYGSAWLRHRNRAVSAQDLEDLALASSPDVAQARCFSGARHTRLIVVMRGANPTPDRATIRELTRALLSVSSPLLARADRLRVEGPKLRSFGITVDLRTSDLRYGSELEESARDAIRMFFDVAAGGTDGEGWPLGQTPTEEDVATSLVDLPHLEGIGGIDLVGFGASGALAADELALLTPERIVVVIGLEEAMA